MSRLPVFVLDVNTMDAARCSVLCQPMYDPPFKALPSVATMSKYCRLPPSPVENRRHDAGCTGRRHPRKESDFRPSRRQIPIANQLQEFEHFCGHLLLVQVFVWMPR